MMTSYRVLLVVIVINKRIIISKGFIRLLTMCMETFSVQSQTFICLLLLRITKRMNGSYYDNGQVMNSLHGKWRMEFIHSGNFAIQSSFSMRSRPVHLIHAFSKLFHPLHSLFFSTFFSFSILTTLVLNAELSL